MTQLTKACALKRNETNENFNKLVNSQKLHQTFIHEKLVVLIKFHSKYLCNIKAKEKKRKFFEPKNESRFDARQLG